MDHLQRSLLNTFVVNGIDHLSTRRNDQSWIESQLEHEPMIFCMWRGNFLVSGEGAGVQLLTFSADEVRGMDGFEQTIFLGQITDQQPTDQSNRSVFAAVFDRDEEDIESALSSFGHLIDLRKAGVSLAPQQAALVAHAKALDEWHSRTRFCPRCASPLRVVSAGHVLRCSGDGCGRDHFPRLDPAIIVRVVIDERILLGRQAVWAPQQYSVIAGFSEPGESLEQSVAREVFEETGIPVSEVHYQSSQPWPFPSNMMLGYEAVASHDRIQPNDDELEDAQWFSRPQIVQMLEAKSLRVPPAVSISFRLIESWFDQGDCGVLKEIVDRTGTNWVPPPQAS